MARRQAGENGPESGRRDPKRRKCVGASELSPRKRAVFSGQPQSLEFSGVGGGAGRTRTCNQTVMSGATERQQ